MTSPNRVSRPKTPSTRCSEVSGRRSHAEMAATVRRNAVAPGLARRPGAWPRGRAAATFAAPVAPFAGAVRTTPDGGVAVAVLSRPVRPPSFADPEGDVRPRTGLIALP